MTQFICKGVKQINNRISLNMTFTFTIRISRRFSWAREFQMGNFQKYWSQNVGQDFIVLYFFRGWNILKVDRRDGRDPQNRENIFLLGGDRVGGKGVCRRLMSPMQETQSMREIRLLRGRLSRKGGRLTGMVSWIKKILDPLNQGPRKVLLISYHLDASGREKLWYLSPSGLKQLANKFNSFWRDVILHYASIVIIHPQPQRKF